MELAFVDFSNMKIDGVITDIFMPGMGGIEGIITIRKRWPRVAIIAMSAGLCANTREDALKAASRIGADAVLSKPFTKDQLIETLVGLVGVAECA